MSGSQGSGKSFLTEECLAPHFLKKFLWPVSLAYANQLKIDTQLEHNLSFEDVHIIKDEKTRPLLQKKGLEKRQLVSQTYWIDQLHQHVLIHLYNGANVIFITDNRFLNEFDYIKSTFGKRSLLVRIEAENRVEDKYKNDYKIFREDGTINVEETNKMINKIRNHPSETEALLYNKWDIVINNSYGNELNSSNELIRKISESLAYKAFEREINKLKKKKNG